MPLDALARRRRHLYSRWHSAERIWSRADQARAGAARRARRHLASQEPAQLAPSAAHTTAKTYTAPPPPVPRPRPEAAAT